MNINAENYTIKRTKESPLQCEFCGASQFAVYLLFYGRTAAIH